MMVSGKNGSFFLRQAMKRKRRRKPLASANRSSIVRIEHLDASKFEDKLELFSRFLRKSEVESLKKKFESEAV
jgi:hypothetical protein